jgi:DNA helicase-2/ATP-dependent DNA helicase PcrA
LSAGCLSFDGATYYFQTVAAEGDGQLYAINTADGTTTEVLPWQVGVGLFTLLVFITGCEDILLPLRFGPDDDPHHIQEERRLFFVGMTRARKRLFLSHARRRLWRGQIRLRRRNT